ncbi:MAG TPA: glycosyltransferase family 39 protein [Acidimicrobiales bacterium]|nr:glycosyltransferase family 39 protein [Acidimicrobiales bacterium]
MSATASSLRSDAATVRERPTATARLLAAGRDQAVVAGGQLVAGAGNLLFIAVAARALRPDGFGHLAAFVAVLTALHLPGAGLAAAGALSPQRARHLERTCTRFGLASAAVVAAAAGPVSDLLGLPIPFVLALAAAAPVAPLLGLRRGLAYGSRQHGAVVASLVAEPAARLVLGLGLGLAAGAAGAAWGAAAGGGAALLALHRTGWRPPAGSDREHGARDTGAGRDAPIGLTAAGISFVVLALLQHQDLIISNRVLGGGDAAAFAALSTLGGLVAFATATLPLVLLPSHRDRGGVAVAVAAALAIALGSVAVALVGGAALVSFAVGARYAHVAPLLPVYLAAMGALGVARVLAAHRCAAGAGRRVRRVALTAAGLHVAGVLLLARTPGQVVAVTTTALVGTAGVLAFPRGWEAPAHAARRGWLDAARDLWQAPDAKLLTGLTVVAVLVRLATERSFWIDEAISVQQAQMSLGDMLRDLQLNDVHPPLHHLVLWVVVRLFGTAEWAMRLPSVLFGAALVPVVHGLTREAFDRRTARVAATLVVPAPFLVWYSQEARMYSLFMLLGAAAIWAQLAALRRGRWGAFVAWGALCAMLVWTQWFALLPLAVQQVATVWHLVRRRGEHGTGRLVARWLGSLLVLALLVAPLLPFLAGQLSAYGGRGAGLSAPSAAGADSSSVAGGLSAYAVIANLVWALLGYHSDDVMLRLGALWPLAMLACLLLLGRRLSSRSRLLLAVAVLPGVALFAIAHAKRDLFELRYFVLAAPLLLVLVARAATTLARRGASLGVLVGGLLVVSSLGLVDQQLNGTNPRLYDFRGAVAAIERTARPGDVLAFAPTYLDGVLDYYAPDLEGHPLGSFSPEEVDGQIYVVVSERFLKEGAAARVGKELAALEAVRGTPERIDRPNVVIWRFS